MQINPSTLEFVKKLKKNNNKNWFDKHRQEYEEARENFVQFTEALIGRIALFDSSVKGLTARECVFRIYKDVRFSKDKTPYKTHFGASISNGRKKVFNAGYYFHLEPGHSFFAAGMYMPDPEVLAKTRQEIDYNSKAFLKILNQKDFKKYYGKMEEEDKLKRPPRGYKPENPMIEYLKLKHFVVSHYFGDSRVFKRDFLSYAGKILKIARPLNKFLTTALE